MASGGRDRERPRARLPPAALALAVLLGLGGGRAGAAAAPGGGAAGVAAAPTAGGAAPDKREAARAKLKEGAARMTEGDYAGALAAFEAAYALVPSPKIQFNIGAAYDALVRYAAAHDAFTRFLADPQDAPAETVAKARAHLAALDKKVARIAVTAAAGSEVFVDGQPRGMTPLAAPIVVDSGAHAVTVRRGEARWSDDFTLGAGEERPVVVAELAARPPVVEPGVPPPVPPAAMGTESGVVAVSPPPARPIYRRPLFWGLVGGAVVVAAAAVVIAIAAGSTVYPVPDRGFELK